MTTKHYFIYTFGCAMNEYDTERIAAALEAKGYIPSDKVNDSDFIVLNTCSVREKPQVKILSYLGQIRLLKEKNPNIIVGISGCVAQQEGNKFLKNNKVVNFVMGTDAISHIDNIIERAINGERFADTYIDSSSFSISNFNRKDKIAANVTIMKGCNNFCSYCIVPYVRGREVSRPSTEILNEIKSLIDKGAKEVCLLGQNVNSYGKNLSEDINFPKLLSMVNKIDGLERIRFVTSHPKDFSINMINAMAENEKVYRYLHLPLQSGSNIILKAMNRKYTYEDYKEKIELARKIMPDIEFSSDFIIGFPNETDEDFNATLKAVEEIGYDRIFAFNYSPRPGTKAFDIEDNVPANVKSERLNTLFTFQDSLYDKKLTEMKGITTQVLVTDIDETKEYSYYGLNIYNRKVAFSSKNKLEYGSIVNVLIDTAKRNCMYGIEV
ncbi:tRNA (N6-isopentenyl adenosine(37)-C2)-methylthiotransferase MiaB [Mucispirillum schaedleri]|jgi:tRNA-2-methylthio-N6-dimethylallyladenosine synthase|uniref:tRNA-2-methylthio-N(6)-dimethylallyladenosine synthase n=1 Tax=Mucispirillum schaedleri ASF457 TaxID=1379858 RepID=V2QE98_9BACT|nr:tRNA (N6-isopentenyl adenosine(37)-C2)-methylthiotransferase MiaB [Mucispirillum schaedleri]MCX4360016.1 tRNA (N6-isopentenyl adenosine(37)-C2)-methylthiotransferase MiaB [Mucispirillum schaedleri]USF23246.1 tRNA-2-methylthio-N(6)-dimethylallyladenosine synthase [Mucispirillum schaedleri ASF457]SIW05019.1 (Dimethylallyl)adenosine tRNA methylthiotransferase MiaB [Mucispirillum schaedleri ASF457]